MAEFWKELESVKELIKAVADAKVDFIWEKDDGCKITIKAGEKKPPMPPMPPMSQLQMPVSQVSAMQMQPVDYIPMTSQNVVQQAVQTENTQEQSEQEAGVQIVTSPLVGTFYSAASPDDEPFVKVGDRVSKGQKLGIIEAMKLMNDIESDFDGEIVEVMVSNESMVEYGQPLFKIR
jgi:acetyl-CoA carboxylase biotin carboxyl carrier protein